jgi:dolichyl-phosphate beta-glucosyltransferase
VKMAGHRIDRSGFRHLQGRVFATLVERLFSFGFYDTQCGVKFFRAALLRPELSHLAESRWLIDVELLALLHRRGARMREEPIDWSADDKSNVVFGVDAMKMFAGLLALKRRVDGL